MLDVVAAAAAAAAAVPTVAVKGTEPGAPGDKSMTSELREVQKAWCCIPMVESLMKTKVRSRSVEGEIADKSWFLKTPEVPEVPCM